MQKNKNILKFLVRFFSVNSVGYANFLVDFRKTNLRYMGQVSYMIKIKLEISGTGRLYD